MSRTRRSARTPRGRFVVVTGLSGAGKSQALRALEDIGYFCVDNLPTQLIPMLAALARRENAGLQKVAIVADVREATFVRDFPKVWKRLKETADLEPHLIFLEANQQTLLRRFSETRRPHPLALDRPVVDGIRAERRKLKPIRALADQIVDTTNLTVHQLREQFLGMAEGRASRRRLLVTLVSFGYKHGVPLDADLVFDVRFLPNPHFVDGLRPLTGQHRRVVRFLEQQPITREFIDRLRDLLVFLVPQYLREGKPYLTIAIGCPGGRHRPVIVAEALAPALQTLKGVRVRVRHRDVEQQA